MVRVPVTGQHHKQKQTIIGWCGKYDGDKVSDAIEDLIRDPEAPLHQKGRKTITLTSVHETKEFIEEHDEAGDFTWYL